ncbi:MAG TPA: PEGA domain-containing protein [Pseudomonadota bacterium]|nr:PEGA domain-containing protein [Pseudomonadota bacterium]
MTLTSLVAVGTATPALAAEKQVVIFEPKVEGGNIGDLEKQALDKALADAVKDMGYSPIPKDDLDAVLAGEKAGKCESAECQIRIARLLDAGYVLRYKVNVSADVVEQAAKHGKKEKEKEKPKGKSKDKEPEPQSPVQAAPVPSGPTANWKFTASLFNVTLAATAESAQNQPSECPNCSSPQAAQNIAELAKKLLIADKSHPRGTIEISTTPGEAQVFVDNVELTGKTPEGKPLSVKTFAGKHKLRVKKTDFQSQEQDVTVSDASPSVLNLTLKPGTDPEKVVYVATDTRRPKWRVALGVVGIAAGAALVGFGGVAFSVNGQPVLDNGQEDRTRIYNTKGLAAGLIAPGATLMMGGAVLIALPGEKKPDPNATPSPTQTLSLAPVGTGTGLVFRSSY